MKYKLEISFDGKQNSLEAEDCFHHYSADTIQIRGTRMFIGEGIYMREVNLNLPIKRFKVKLKEKKE